MASRGVNFQFRVDDRVLCFEPDPKKAKVLYEAKILETHVGRDRNGARLPEYLIHFNGWSSSWDRRISEQHLLRLTPDNVALAKRLRDEARRIRSNNARKRKIDEILDQVFNRRTRQRLSGSSTGRRKRRGTAAGDDDNDTESSSSSRSTSGSSSSDDNDDDDDDGTLSVDDDRSSTAAATSASSHGSEGASNGRLESAAERSSTNSDDDAGTASSRGRRRPARSSTCRRRQRQQQARAESNASGERSSGSRKGANWDGKDEDEDADEAVVYAAPPESAPRLELPMPPNLRKILMADCRQVHRKAAKPAALVAQPTVLTILERFLDHFAKHAALVQPAATGELVASSSSSAKAPTTGSALRDPLPPSAETRMRLAEEVVEGVRVVFDCTLPLILLYAAERAQYEDIFVTCTTALASATAADARSSCVAPAGKAAPDSEPDASAAVAEEPPLGRLTRPPISTGTAVARCPMHLRGSHNVGPVCEPRPQRHAGNKGHSSAVTPESSTEPVRRTRAETNNHHHHIVNDATSAPTTATTSAAEVIRSCGHQGTTGLPASDPLLSEPSPACHLLSPAVQAVLPEQYRAVQPPPPCSVYGLPHLLRLLLKLPDLVLRMQMTPEKASSVQFVLQNLIRYLSEETASFGLDSSSH